MVAQANLKVHRVVRGRHLDSSCAKGLIDGGIPDYRDLASNHRHDGVAPDDVFVAWIERIDGHSSIAKNRLRARRGNADIALPLLALLRHKRIAYIGKLARSIDVIDLQIGDGAHTAWAPVDDALAAIDQPLFVEAHKDLAHSSGEPFIQRK